MVARSAYVQLRRSPLLLVADHARARAGVPGAAGWPRCSAMAARAPAGLAAWAIMAATFLPTLRRFGLSPLWARGAAGDRAASTCAATIGSALDHHRGRGVVWKRRAYAGRGAMSDAGSDVEAWSGKDRGDENFPVGSVLISARLRAARPCLLRLRPQRRRHRRQRRCSPPTTRWRGSTSMEDVLLGRRDAGSPSALRPAREPGRDRRHGRPCRRLAGGVPPRRHQAALCELGRADGLLPLLGHAGRPARARSARRGPRHLGSRRTRCAPRCRC